MIKSGEKFAEISKSERNGASGERNLTSRGGARLAIDRRWQAEEGAYGAGYFLLPELGSLRPLILSGEVLLRQVDPLND